jgi:very-short-patch-repair endonuclease
MNATHNQNLTPNAQMLRGNMTREERHLWYDCLKNLPVSFKRQKIIGNFIVDFYCPSAKLVVERDGSQHYDEKGRKTDQERDNYLQSLGLVIKRYSNTDINKNFYNVCEDIYHFIISINP